MTPSPCPCGGMPQPARDYAPLATSLVNIVCGPAQPLPRHPDRKVQKTLRKAWNRQQRERDKVF